MYTVDISTEIDDELLVKFKDLQSLKPTPDMTYKFVAKAPENLTDRPVVVGFGPCGLFIGLVLAQMGYRPIILDRGKEVRERTKDTFGFWRKKNLIPNRMFSLVKVVQVRFLTENYIPK